jgi:NAD(P)-dependent dehydrogenase (short-subunit alcohol dehydrogenase family)
VTGGTGALGRAVVARFARDGSVVHVPWVAEAEVEEVKGQFSSLGGVHLHQCDVTSDAEVQNLFRTIGADGRGVEVLANVVGGFAYGSLEQTDPATWERMLRLNATTAFLCSRAAVPEMKVKRWGRIINVSSAPAVNRGGANLSAYAAAKAAVLNLSESLAKELAPWRITVNAIVPTVIDTPANRKSTPGADTSTWLKPEEIADVIAFLASDAAGIVNGTAVNLARG